MSYPFSIASPTRNSSFRVLFPPPYSPDRSSLFIQTSNPFRCLLKLDNGCTGVGSWANEKHGYFDSLFNSPSNSLCIIMTDIIIEVRIKSSIKMGLGFELC